MEPEYHSSSTPEGGQRPMDRDELMRRTGPLYPGLVALRQLTYAPALGQAIPTAEDARRAAPWFPAVGGLVGGLLALLALLVLETGLVPAIAGALAIAAAMILTGGLHERGFARSIEALTGAPSYGTAALGLYGVVSIIALLAARGVFLLGIDPHAWVGAILVSQMVLRWTPVFLQRIGDPLGEAPRGERSLLVGPVSWFALGLGSAFVVVVAILFAGWTGVLSLAIAAGVAFGVGLYYQKREGGLTNDSLGAASVVCELAVLLCFAAAQAATTSPWAS